MEQLRTLSEVLAAIHCPKELGWNIFDTVLVFSSVLDAPQTLKTYYLFNYNN